MKSPVSSPRILFMHGLESGPRGDKVVRLREAGLDVEAADMRMSIRRLDRENSVVRNLLRARETQVAGLALAASLVTSLRSRRVFPMLTAKRNLALGARKTRFRQWTATECCEIFPALPHLIPRECENMSGGELQMVAISRALLGSPGIVLFDEPSQGLAPKVVQDVLKTIRRMKDEGVASLVVEQNAMAALGIADRVYVMDRGRIIHEGPAAELLADVVARKRLLGV